MITMKTLGLAIGIACAASSFALAQQGNPTNNPAANNTQQGNPTNNAAASGGAGTHQNNPRTGSAATTQKTLHSQQGYREGRGRRLYGYSRGARCHIFRHPVSRRLVTICH
jgi:hypothetical protein